MWSSAQVKFLFAHALDKLKERFVELLLDNIFNSSIDFLLNKVFHCSAHSPNSFWLFFEIFRTLFQCLEMHR